MGFSTSSSRAAQKTAASAMPETVLCIGPATRPSIGNKSGFQKEQTVPMDLLSIPMTRSDSILPLGLAIRVCTELAGYLPIARYGKNLEAGARQRPPCL